MRALWNAAFPEEELRGLISEQWKEMGWQGKDPSTDFRHTPVLFLFIYYFLSDDRLENFMIAFLFVFPFFHVFHRHFVFQGRWIHFVGELVIFC